jgi:hypothetical protein
MDRDGLEQGSSSENDTRCVSAILVRARAAAAVSSASTSAAGLRAALAGSDAFASRPRAARIRDDAQADDDVRGASAAT